MTEDRWRRFENDEDVVSWLALKNGLDVASQFELLDVENEMREKERAELLAEPIYIGDTLIEEGGLYTLQRKYQKRPDYGMLAVARSWTRRWSYGDRREPEERAVTFRRFGKRGSDYVKAETYIVDGHTIARAERTEPTAQQQKSIDEWREADARYRERQREAEAYARAGSSATENLS